MKSFNLLFLIFLFTTCSLLAQFKQQSFSLSGNLSEDSKLLLGNYHNPSASLNFSQEKKKSPLLAGALSMVLPGAGEFYTEDYIKSAIFLALEAAVVTTAIVYDKKGDDKTKEFQDYADKNWSVVRYAEYLNSKGARIPIDPNTSLPPWKRVNWDSLHLYETGSHHLEKFGYQQYYEMIGKYLQFSSGWPDFISESSVPAMMTFYAGMRGKANDYYNVATKAVIGIYINHFLSIVDAVWSAISFNKNLQISASLKQNFVGYQLDWTPKLDLKYNF